MRSRTREVQPKLEIGPKRSWSYHGISNASTNVRASQKSIVAPVSLTATTTLPRRQATPGGLPFISHTTPRRSSLTGPLSGTAVLVTPRRVLGTLDPLRRTLTCPVLRNQKPPKAPLPLPFLTPSSRGTGGVAAAALSNGELSKPQTRQSFLSTGSFIVANLFPDENVTLVEEKKETMSLVASNSKVSTPPQLAPLPSPPLPAPATSLSFSSNLDAEREAELAEARLIAKLERQIRHLTHQLEEKTEESHRLERQLMVRQSEAERNRLCQKEREGMLVLYHWGVRANNISAFDTAKAMEVEVSDMHSERRNLQVANSGRTAQLLQTVDDMEAAYKGLMAWQRRSENRIEESASSSAAAISSTQQNMEESRQESEQDLMEKLQAEAQADSDHIFDLENEVAEYGILQHSMDREIETYRIWVDQFEAYLSSVCQTQFAVVDEETFEPIPVRTFDSIEEAPEGHVLVPLELLQQVLPLSASIPAAAAGAFIGVDMNFAQPKT